MEDIRGWSKERSCTQTLHIAMHFAALLIPLPCSTCLMAYYLLHFFTLFLICLLSQRRNAEQAREKAISVEPYVDNSRHLAVWTWKQANLEPHSPLRCHFAADTLSTSHHVPFARWHSAHHSLCSTLAPPPSTLSLLPVPAPIEAPWPPQQRVLSTSAYQVPADKVAIMTTRRPSKNRAVLRLWKPNDEFAFPGQLASYCFSYNELSKLSSVPWLAHKPT